MTEPIKPEEIEEARKKHLLEEARKIPVEVIEAFNDLIIMNYNGTTGVSLIGKEDILSRIISQSLGRFDRRTIMDSRWLDVEPLYIHAGWSVRYEGSYFHFKK